MNGPLDPTSTALLLCDLQNDFLAPDVAYGRAGQTSPDIAALPARLAPLAVALRAKGGAVGATLFTLVPGRGGEPLIAPHLKALRPFLGAGDFAPGSRGQAVVEALQPVDFAVEKIAYSGFLETRLDWTLRKFGIRTLVFAGIVTNGGVASTLRDAHAREYDCVLLEDGCAAFDPAIHAAAVAGLRPVARVTRVADLQAELGG